MTTTPIPPESAPAIAPGMDVILPNGNTATVGLLSGLSALVGIGAASVWYPIRDLKVAP